MKGILTRSPEPSEVQSSSAKLIEIDSREIIHTAAFLVDGRHVVSGGDKGKIRRWRVEDGMEVGAPMDAGSAVYNIAVSRDGKWIVSGRWQSVQVWSAESGERVSEFKGHSHRVRAIDVSPNSTKIASGAGDNIICVWSLSTGQRLLGPWNHGGDVVAVKFSHDGRLIATTTWKSIYLDLRHSERQPCRQLSNSSLTLAQSLPRLVEQ